MHCFCFFRRKKMFLCETEWQESKNGISSEKKKKKKDSSHCPVCTVSEERENVHFYRRKHVYLHINMLQTCSNVMFHFPVCQKASYLCCSYCGTTAYCCQARKIKMDQYHAITLKHTNVSCYNIIAYY